MANLYHTSLNVTGTPVAWDDKDAEGTVLASHHGHVISHGYGECLIQHGVSGKLVTVKAGELRILSKSAAEQAHHDVYSELSRLADHKPSDTQVYAELHARAKSATAPSPDTYDLVTPAQALDKIIEATPSEVPQVSRWTWPLGKASE